jgi:transaldolase
MLLIDSADPDEVRIARDSGLTTGVTMNPTLVARAAPRAPLDVLRSVLDQQPGRVFYQPTAADVGAAEDEVSKAIELGAGSLVVKLPAGAGFTGLIRRLAQDGIPVAMTAVYAPSQAIVAASSRCQWVIPYVNRAARLMPDEPPVVISLAAVLPGGEPPWILAASVKSPREAADAVRQGAHAVTAPLSVLREMIAHPLSDTAIEEFNAATRKAAAGSP